MYVFDNEGNPAGQEEDGVIVTAPTIAGARLMDWITNGVPGVRGTEDGDEVIDSPAVILPSEPLFGLALLDHMDSIGWKITPGAIDFATNWVKDGFIENYDPTQKRDHAGKWTKQLSAGEAARQHDRIPLPSPSEVTVLKTLPGGTHPKLVVDSDGKQWVMKKTDNHGHLINEAIADNVYRALGVPTVNSGIVHTVDGPVKFSEFMKGGETLAEWRKGKSQAEIDAMHKEISKHFATDALMGNWDVIGSGSNNILIKDGVPYRIDNGGALKYRALGTKKNADEWGAVVGELQSLRNHSLNPDSTKVFAGLTEAEIHAQIHDLLGKKDTILGAVKDQDTKQVLQNRLDYLAKYVKGQPAPKAKESTPFEKAAAAHGIEKGGNPNQTIGGADFGKQHQGPLPIPAAGTPGHAAQESAKAGPYDPKDIHSIVDHVTKNPGEATFAPLYKDKLKFLNPNGVENGVFYIPTFPTGEASSLKKVEQLQKLLPPGTVIKKKKVSAEDLAKAGHQGESEKIAKALEPKPLLAPGIGFTPYPGAAALSNEAASWLSHISDFAKGKSSAQLASHLSHGNESVKPIYDEAAKHLGLGSNYTFGELAESIKKTYGGNEPAQTTPSAPAQPKTKLSAKAKKVISVLESFKETGYLSYNDKAKLSNKLYSLPTSEQKAVYEYFGAANTGSIHSLFDHLKPKAPVPSTTPTSPPPPPPPSNPSGELHLSAKNLINKTIAFAHGDQFNHEKFKTKLDKLAPEDKAAVLKHFGVAEHETEKVGEKAKAMPKPKAPEPAPYQPPAPKAGIPPLPTAPAVSYPPQHNGGKKVHKAFPAGNPGNQTAIKEAFTEPKDGTLTVHRTQLYDVPTNEKWAASLTSEEHYVISQWKGSATAIRGGYAKGEHLIPGTPAYYHYSAVMKSPPYEAVLYRGIHGKYAGDVAAACLAAGPGAEWTDVSAHGLSPNPTVGMHFSYGEAMLRVHAKTAHPIQKAGGFTSTGSGTINEMEVIGEPGKKYRIKAVHKDVTIKDPVTGKEQKVKHVIDLEEI